ncbi:hypothetical protein EVAR_14783_1 [Eumeta japonica]|uniref:Uncharacterized protein n=1 Tax=Eumeta variegata TaxID=151549 RepID=A0A4C1TWM4_EUMVA|nr:hypothetical protein EVAR_14783_1 [Eumeta japonica]
MRKANGPRSLKKRPNNYMIGNLQSGGWRVSELSVGGRRARRETRRCRKRRHLRRLRSRNKTTSPATYAVRGGGGAHARMRKARAQAYVALVRPRAPTNAEEKKEGLGEHYTRALHHSQAIQSGRVSCVIVRKLFQSTYFATIHRVTGARNQITSRSQPAASAERANRVTRLFPSKGLFMRIALLHAIRLKISFDDALQSNMTPSHRPSGRALSFVKIKKKTNVGWISMVAALFQNLNVGVTLPHPRPIAQRETRYSAKLINHN